MGAAYDVFAQLRTYLSQLVSFSSAEWEQLMAAAHHHQLRKGEFLLRAPNVNHQLAFINSGVLRTCANHDGKDVTFHFFFENSFATEYASFMTRQASQFSIEALEACELLVFEHDDIQRLFATVAQGQRLARLIAEELYLVLRQRAVSLLLNTPEERYRQLLASHSPILRRVNQYYIATYLGMQPQSLSRIRKRLAHELPPPSASV